MLTTVSIIEDDSTFALLMKQIIDAEQSMACTSIYNNAESAMKELPNHPTDVILMDIQLPDDTGINLTAHFKKLFPSTYIIMCTSFDDDEKVFSSLKAGANGYIIKLDNPESIVQSIEEVIHGGAPMSMGIAKKVIQSFSKSSEGQHKLEILTPKENELLELLSKGSYYKEIADCMHIGIDTVKKHCGNIYKKLQVNNRTEAINIYLRR